TRSGRGSACCTETVRPRRGSAEKGRNTLPTLRRKKWPEPPRKPGALDGVHTGPRRVDKRGQISGLCFCEFLADHRAGSLFGCTWPRNGHDSSDCCQGPLQPARQLQRREALARVEIVLPRLVDDTQQPIALRCSVPERDVDLPRLERRRVPVIRQEFPGTADHRRRSLGRISSTPSQFGIEVVGLVAFALERLKGATSIA